MEALADAGDILLVLDECHHLLEVWGRLLAEVLERLPDARVLGLTATPPEALTREQAALVDELFGEVAHASSIPAVVREGDLAPFAELAWLVSRPRPRGLARRAGARFTELTTALIDPAYGETPSSAGSTRGSSTGPRVPWAEVVAREPELADAALRMDHAGLLARPPEPDPASSTGTSPTVEDWVLLIEDWIATAGTGPTRTASTSPTRRCPRWATCWTRRGVRRGRTTTDRVLARSAAKRRATVDIVTAEHATLGDRLRMLVLCDHERAGATLPADLVGVIDAQAGSAVAVLVALLADPGTARWRRCW